MIDAQDEEPERLFPHAVARSAEREDAHEERDEHRAAVTEPHRQPADTRLDRSGLHRHGNERADGEHEEEDRGGAVQEAPLVRTDESSRVLDAVEPVGRRVPELLEAE
jgi:hypothetical protein